MVVERYFNFFSIFKVLIFQDLFIVAVLVAIVRRSGVIYWNLDYSRLIEVFLRSSCVAFVQCTPYGGAIIYP